MNEEYEREFKPAEKNKRNRSGGHNTKYPWRTMAVNETFTIYNLSKKAAFDATNKAKKRTGRDFSARETADGIIITRLPDPPIDEDRKERPWRSPEITEFLSRLGKTYPDDEQVQNYLHRVRA